MELEPLVSTHTDSVADMTDVYDASAFRWKPADPQVINVVCLCLLSIEQRALSVILLRRLVLSDQWKESIL